MAPLTSSAARLPVYTLGLVRRHWAPLLCVYTGGMLLHALIMRGLVAFNDVEPALALSGLGLTLLITLVTFVVMFQLLRPGLPLVDSELNAEIVRRNKRKGFAERERRVVDGVALAIMPFLLFYGAWGLFEEQYNTYSVDLLNTGGVEAFSAPTEMAWFGMPLLVACSAWLLRRVCGHFYKTGRNPVLGILTALFEGVWMFMVVFSIGVLIGLWNDWIGSRVLWVSVELSITRGIDGFGDLIDVPNLSLGVSAAFAALWATVKEGFIGPMLWLTITAVVYRAQIDDHDALFEERRGGGRFGAAVNRTARLSRIFGKHADSDFRDKFTPCLNAVRFVLGAGPVFYLTFCLYFVLLDLVFSRLHRGVLVLLERTGEPNEVWLWTQPVDFVMTALHMLLRLCLLAATFEIALRKAEETSVGRHLWRVAGHAVPTPEARGPVRRGTGPGRGAH
ncbi:hypothetical protein [Nocardiopsis alba]|uniref:Integral membrane protein n=2 Tax=Nocardiopsis alba TaxID=53437 RepID=A0ABV5E1Y4_9ACTN|nr:hypothetical protein [Nocardiopsis alba]AFR06492.1 putative membrane protein [Nocardiopsis alba ATCC BAA-2165]